MAEMTASSSKNSYLSANTYLKIGGVSCLEELS